MTQTTAMHHDAPETPLHMAMEVSAAEWKLGFARGLEKARVRTIRAGNFEQLRAEIRKTQKLFGLELDAPVYSCYEAGRDGFWIHRELERRRIHNVIVDPASIEVVRHRRRRKTDRLDAANLVRRLVRWVRGERDAWRTVKVPSVAAEELRRLHRERKRLVKEQTGHQTRIRSVLATHGPVPKKLEPAVLQRRSNGTRLPAPTRDELRREWQRLELVRSQLKEVEREIARQENEDESPAMNKVRKMRRLKGIGSVFARTFGAEFFGWRTFQNGRQVGALAGLTGTPYDSGQTNREQGISKAGNRWVRSLAVEMAWMWLRYQPDSALSLWFHARFGEGARVRRIGIVALARKLLVALWKWVEFDELPEGAVLRN